MACLHSIIHSTPVTFINFMWYLKDYQGNETGPYTLDQLLDAFQDPVLKENATLIRSGKEGLWKPAIITFPAIFAAADKVTSVNATALPASDLNLNFPPASVRNQQASDAGPDTEGELGRISAELNRVRYVIVCTTLSLIFSTLVLLSLSDPYTVTGDANSLNIRNALIASAISTYNYWK